MISRSKTWKLKNKRKTKLALYLSGKMYGNKKEYWRKERLRCPCWEFIWWEVFPHWWSTLVIHEASLWLSLVSLTGSHKASTHLFSLSSRVFCILGICWNLLEDYIIGQILRMFKDPSKILDCCELPLLEEVHSLAEWLYWEQEQLKGGITGKDTERIETHWRMKRSMGEVKGESRLM